LHVAPDKSQFIGTGEDSPQAVNSGQQEMQSSVGEMSVNLTIMGMKPGLTSEKKALLHDLAPRGRN